MEGGVTTAARPQKVFGGSDPGIGPERATGYEQTTPVGRQTTRRGDAKPG
jgi:hypothetical protein